ncbi:MAG: 3'-5' exonuclease [Longimicrobiales bacterium]|nr:3'-5' exonuclease [Longimicrobiales bacterium]
MHGDRVVSEAGGLSARVEARLREGRAHTLEIAREVLGLSGHPGAASAAVFALLGEDLRFEVDTEGVWSLGESPATAPLFDLPWAVVDIETTGGGVHRGHRITEIAIVLLEYGRIVDEWTTLVNPGRSIHPAVTALTGITPGMVASAPRFEEIAPEVSARLEGRIFVAHNAGFDLGFVRNELVEAEGEAPSVTSLCTVQLSRALLPALRRRNLDALCRHYDIRIEGRHRAWGDARATAGVLLRLLDEAGVQGIADLATLRKKLRARRGRRRSRSRRSEEDQ